MKNLALSVSALALIAPLHAQAEDAERDPIIVTATIPLQDQAEIAGRLGLTLAETPASVSVISQDQMQAAGLRSAIEVMNAAPGVSSGNLPGSIGSVSMRGFHRAVNYLIDGARMASSDAGIRNWDSWSFERIEVIKGPASVTSGEGALAGAINFVPRRAKPGEFSGEVLASYGSFDSVRLAGDINLPLGETAALHGNAVWSRSSGWVDDTDSRQFAGTASLLVKPVERLSITLSADYARDDYGTAYYGTPGVSRAVARDPSNAVSGSAGLVLDRAMRRVNFDVADGDTNSESLWLRARINYDLSDRVTLTSDSSWYTADRLWRDADEYGFDAASGLINRSTSLITHDHRFWNQRVQLAFDGPIAGHRNRFTLGVEAAGTEFFTKRRFGSAGLVDPFNPARGSFPVADTPANFGTRQDVWADSTSLAVFAENAFNVTPEWLLVGGVRFDDIGLDRRVVNVTSGAEQIYGQDYDPLTWRVGTVYTLAPGTQLYAQYSRAVTPVSGLLFLSAGNAAFHLTSGRSWEGGIKAALWGNRLTVTAALFDIRQDDILTRDPANPAVVFQGGSIQSTGGEVALEWRPAAEWTLGAQATLLDARLKNLVEAGGIDRSGNRPPNVPERQAGVTLGWAPRALPLRMTAAMMHKGDAYTDNANGVRLAAYTTFDASISWDSPLATVTLRGRNLTDSFHAEWSGYASGLVFIGAPRSVDVTLSRRF
ncbi:TonB-dependent siderophore receptor [Altererythrobacter xixiisoli]|uniref:TonB-dependent siderophore receptor n=1 Tax=Croceibacterium xixiisoli TaxID=1476466 RepID=A0A6I4U273_9SPHN|nr:TonB-dependent siderophore receptor [Croceibacterium xixiisoli]MXP00734.1 TonB-dependent siderophore receptor [Croceibacterium xixiisoli]